MAYDLIQEKFTDQNKSAIKTNLSAKDIQFSDHFSNDGETSDIISFSNLTGLDYNNFEREFIKLCTTMKERYKSNILYISMDEFVLTHEDLAQDITQLSINNMRGNLYANIYHICTVKLDQLKNYGKENNQNTDKGIQEKKLSPKLPIHYFGKCTKRLEPSISSKLKEAASKSKNKTLSIGEKDRIFNNEIIENAPIGAFENWNRDVASKGTFYYNGESSVINFGFNGEWVISPY